jgi:uncharacterized membrane protein
MDFIERWLGFAPDNAGRAVEILILVVLVSVITGLALHFLRVLAVGIAIVIAGATAVRAQTLPFYTAEAVNEHCRAELENQAETNAKKGIAPPETVCALYRGLNNADRDELARRWTSIDASIRTQCVVTKQVVDYSTLKSCIEILEKRGPTTPDEVIRR